MSNQPKEPLNIPASILRVLLGIVAWSVISTSAHAAGKEQKISSPDGRIQVTVQFDKELNCSVNYGGTPLMMASRLGLTFAGGLKLGENVQLLQSETRRNNTQWRDDFGKFSRVKDHDCELRLCFWELRSARAAPANFELIMAFTRRPACPGPGRTCSRRKVSSAWNM